MRSGARYAFFLATFVSLTIVGALPLQAGDPRKPSADEIVKELSREPQTRAMGLSRGFVPGGRGVSVEGPTESVARPSVDLEVNFEFNSTRLSTDAMLTLDQLGRAFNDPALAGMRFQIAGHTDGKGTEPYNQKLSEQRAAAVKAYMVTKHRVDGTRLETVGLGESQLIDPAHPEAAINRRVQVTKVGG